MHLLPYWGSITIHKIPGLTIKRARTRDLAGAYLIFERSYVSAACRDMTAKPGEAKVILLYHHPPQLTRQRDTAQMILALRFDV
jgi:hypothetical protein